MLLNFLQLFYVAFVCVWPVSGKVGRHPPKNPAASGWDEILPDVTLYFSFNYYNVPVSIYKRVMKTDTVQLYYLPALIFDEAQANWAIAQGKIYFNLFVEDDDLVRAANSAFQQVKSKYSPVRFILPIPIKAVRIVRVSGTLAGLDNTWSSWNCIDYGAQATKCRLSLKCIDQAACHAISEDFTHRLAEFPRDFRVYYSLTERMDGQLLWLDRPNESEAHSITVLNKNIGHPVDQIIMAKPGKEGTKPVSATTVALPSTAESVWKFTRSSTSDPDLVDPVDELDEHTASTLKEQILLSADQHPPKQSPGLKTPQENTKPASLHIILPATASGILLMTIIILLYLYRRQLKSQWARLGTPRQPLDSDNDPTSSDLTTTDFERGAMLPPESASLDLSESMFDNRASIQQQLIITNLFMAQYHLERFIINRERITMTRRIGSGNFGEVHLGFLAPPNATGNEQGPRVAIKSLKNSELPTAREIEVFLKECSLMVDLSHENVMQLLGVCLEEVRGALIPRLVMPYMEGGSLKDYAVQHPPLDQREVLRFTIQIAKGMRYLSELPSQRLIHGDLAARNCMLDNNMRVIIADFGLSRDVHGTSNLTYRTSNAQTLPWQWMAPECVYGSGTSSRVYFEFSNKSDVWSFGVVTWELFQQARWPYDNDPRLFGRPVDLIARLERFLVRNYRLAQPSSCSDSLYQLMLRCWSMDPVDRPDFEEIHSQLRQLSSLPFQTHPDDYLQPITE